MPRRSRTARRTERANRYRLHQDPRSKRLEGNPFKRSYEAFLIAQAAQVDAEFGAYGYSQVSR